MNRFRYSKEDKLRGEKYLMKKKVVKEYAYGKKLEGFKKKWEGVRMDERKRFWKGKREIVFLDDVEGKIVELYCNPEYGLGGRYYL